MNKTVAEALELVKQLKESLKDVNDAEIVVCPPFTALSSVFHEIKDSNIALGAQNAYFEEKGAFTGEISILMLKDAGCKFVIIGHSERRHIFDETNEMVNKKIKSAIKNGLTPIVCVGETLEEREDEETNILLEEQIKNGLMDLIKDELLEIVIAYEPVWAIGTGKNATPEQAEEAHLFIRQMIAEMHDEETASNIRVIYGGSVTPENIKGFMEKDNIDGALVGGASLKADSLVSIS